MKKIFFFAATMMAVMTINATVYDFTALTAESDWTVTNATKNTTETKEDKGKFVYDIAADVEATVVPSKLTNDIVFSIKNGSDKKKAFNINLAKGFEFGGKNGILTIDNVKIGDKIVITVASKGSTAANFEVEGYPKGAITVTTDLVCPVKGGEGADDEGYVWKEIEYTASATSVVIKEGTAGYRIKAVEVVSATANENVKADAVKAVKTIENGQLVIIKGNNKYDALGTFLGTVE